MKKISKQILSLSIFGLGLLSAANAQIEIPQPSPKSTLVQEVGVTKITIEYSSPAVKGRVVWGDLVPYDQVWRTGANKATAVTFSKDVKIGGVEVKAGSYSIFTIPGKEEWTMILNKNTELWGSDNYKETEDAVRIKVKPEPITFRERLLFTVSNFDNNKAQIDMEWERVKVSIPIELNSHEQAVKSVNNSFASYASQYAGAARYMLDNDKDLNEALKWINISISLNETWFNNWIKAQIFAKQNNYKEALKFAQKAKELGDKLPNQANFFYKSQVEKAIAEWSKK